MLRFSHGGCEQRGRFLNGFDANMQKKGKNTSHRNEKRLLFFTQAWNKENNPTENENPSPCVVQRFI